jgi:anti-sigma factor (TIGR02949 family)
LLTCKDFLKEISEFLDDATDPSTKQELERHMAECPNCFVVFDTCKQTVRVFKGTDAREIPASISGRLMGALKKKMAAKHGGCESSPAAG